MINTAHFRPIERLFRQRPLVNLLNGQRDEHKRAARRLALSILPVPLLALAEPALSVTACLWLAVALYGGLVMWARGGTFIKLLEIGVAVTLGSLALVTHGP
jgi:hypothetical protein